MSSSVPPSRSGRFRLVSGAAAGPQAMTQAFNRGFQGYRYAVHFTPAQLTDFLLRSGMAPEDCPVLLAWEEGRWQGAGVAVLAVEGVEAWCGGLGVASEYRGQGWGERLMLALHERARARGAQSLLLEVLVDNEPAQRLYRKLGYQEERELLIWERPARQGALPVPFERLEPADPLEVLEKLHAWHDQPPCWQRRASFLRRSAALMEAYTIPAKDGLPVAYVLCKAGRDPESSRAYLRIFDLATDPQADVLMAARPLLQALQLTYMDADLLLFNEPVESKLNRVFAALGFLVKDRQMEMRRVLGGE